MSRGTTSRGPSNREPVPRDELLGDLVREIRQFNGLGASFFRAVAGRVGMNATDLQVVDILDVAGPMTAGQLAEFTGLTSGAIAQMLTRLEEAGLVRREKDPEDGRRVVVRLVPGGEATREIGPLFASATGAWEEMAEPYDDGQLAFLLGFVRHANAVSREELYRLREVPEVGQGGNFSAPLGDQESGRLVFSSWASRLVVRAGTGKGELYRARFEGPVPEVKVEGGTVTVRYPRRLRIFDRNKQAAEVALSAAVPWRIEIRGGASEVIAELGSLALAGLEVKGGMSTFRVDLPAPSTVVPIRITGGASDIIARRPPGVAVRVRLKGWVSQFTFDDQTYGGMGNDVRVQSPGYEDATRRYDVEVSGSASDITLTTSG